MVYYLRVTVSHFQGLRLGNVGGFMPGRWDRGVSSRKRVVLSLSRVGLVYLRLVVTV